LVQKKDTGRRQTEEKTQHRKLKQHGSHQTPGMNPGAPEG